MKVTMIGLEQIKNFLLDAGNIAIEKQQALQITYKDSGQILTNVDLEISKMLGEYAVEWFKDETYVVIDEETNNMNPQQALENYNYLCVIDPIDGTAGYALGRRLWGVSLGIFHKGHPVSGGIYMPGLQTILLADAEQSLHIDMINNKKTLIKAKKMNINKEVFIESYFGCDRSWGKGFDSNFWFNTPESAVQGYYNTLLNQSAGATAINALSLWDFAGAICIAKNTGHQIYNMKTDERLYDITASMFHNNWRIKDNWIVCHPENYQFIKTALLTS